MSLHDPVALRRAQQERAKRRPARLYLWLPLMLLADALFSLVVVGVAFGAFRYMAIRDQDSLDLTNDPIWIWGFVVSLPTVIIFGVLVIGRLGRRVGRGPAILLRGAISCAVSVALFPVSVSLWLPLGTLPAGNRPADWGWWKHAWYSMGEWGGIALIVAAVLLAGLATLSILRRRSRARAIEHVAQNGIVATGVVTGLDEIGRRRDTRTLEVLDVIVRVTLKFTDRNGQSRWAEQIGKMLPGDVPAIGDRVQLRYDPDRPADVRIMTFELPWTTDFAGGSEFRPGDTFSAEHPA
jgi:hypothetical protein